MPPGSHPAELDEEATPVARPHPTPVDESRQTRPTVVEEGRQTRPTVVEEGRQTRPTVVEEGRQARLETIRREHRPAGDHLLRFMAS